MYIYRSAYTQENATVSYRHCNQQNELSQLKKSLNMSQSFTFPNVKKYLLERLYTHPEIILVLLGFCLRLLFINHSNHIYYPDEIFQTLEPAHHLVFGYGIIAWDYLYGIRSFIIPFIYTVPQLIAKFMFADTGSSYRFLSQFYIICFSLITILAVYRLTLHVSSSKKMAYLSGLISAIWYELIYFSGRALTETLATAFFALAYIIPKEKMWHYLLFGLLTGCATLIRPQYFIISLALIFITLQGKSLRISALTLGGVIFSIIIFGIADLATYGKFLISFLNNYNLSFSSGISEVFGTKPMYYYLVSLIITSGGLVLALPLSFKNTRLRTLLFLYLIILSLHSLIPHKEYRFIYILIPLGIPLYIYGWYYFLDIIFPTTRWHYKSIFLVSLFISFLGYTGHLPKESLVYPQPPSMKDGLLTLISRIPDNKTACSLYIPDRDWVYSGGYYYLHRPLELYSHDYPPPAAVIPHYLILPRSLSPPANYLPVANSQPYQFYVAGKQITHPGYSLYELPAPCHPSPEYSEVRLFVYLNQYLQSVTTYPNIFKSL